MKKILFSLLGWLIILVPISSCSKTRETNTSGIFGKWELQETYDGYFNGGTFIWKKISADYAKTLQLDRDLHYTEIETSLGQANTCMGTFNFSQSDSVLTAQSNCNPVPTRIKVLQYQNSLLILEVSVFEGVIRYKYGRIGSL